MRLTCFENSNKNSVTTATLQGCKYGIENIPFHINEMPIKAYLVG